jgi:hypothetical protein
MTRAERERTHPAAAGFEPWWDHDGGEVHYCHGFPGVHGQDTHALPPGATCQTCSHVAKHPPESTTLPQDAPGGVGTATETKTPSARKGEAVAATGEGALVGPYAYPIGTVLGWEYGYEDHVCLNQSRYRLAPTQKCSLCGHVAAKEKSVFFKPPTAPECEPKRIRPMFEIERDEARAQLKLAREECERLKASNGTLRRMVNEANEERDEFRAARDKALDATEAERERLRCERDKLRGMVNAGVDELMERGKRVTEALAERDRLKAELAKVTSSRDAWRDRYAYSSGGKVATNGGDYVSFQDPGPNRKDSLMRRLIKSAWKFVIIPGLLLSSAAHVVPLSRVYEAAQFESRGAYHEFQVCAKCSASRAGGAVCPACGSRESSSLVGREVTTRLLGVWKTGTRWTAEGEIAREAR